MNASDLNLVYMVGMCHLLPHFTLVEFSFTFALGHLFCMERHSLELTEVLAVLCMPCCARADGGKGN